MQKRRFHSWNVEHLADWHTSQEKCHSGMTHYKDKQAFVEFAVKRDHLLEGCVLSQAFAFSFWHCSRSCRHHEQSNACRSLWELRQWETGLGWSLSLHRHTPAENVILTGHWVEKFIFIIEINPWGQEMPMSSHSWSLFIHKGKRSQLLGKCILWVSLSLTSPPS